MGQIGVVSLIIEDDLLDNLAPDTNVDLRINNIRLIDDEFESIPVWGDSVIFNLLTLDNKLNK